MFTWVSLRSYYMAKGKNKKVFKRQAFYNYDWSVSNVNLGIVLLISNFARFFLKQLSIFN